MRIGVPAETLPGERRVALVPTLIAPLTKAGLEIVVEQGAGASAGFPDDVYVAEGARLAQRDEVFASSDVLLQVRTPLADPATGDAEVPLLSSGQTVIGLAEPAQRPGARSASSPRSG